jgi:hypothetical protein
MNKKTATWTRRATRINVAVGILWIGIALRDLFAPGLFSFSPNVASNSTIVLDFAAGAVFLLCAFCLHQARLPTR